MTRKSLKPFTRNKSQPKKLRTRQRKKCSISSKWDWEEGWGEGKRREDREREKEREKGEGVLWPFQSPSCLALVHSTWQSRPQRPQHRDLSWQEPTLQWRSGNLTRSNKSTCATYSTEQTTWRRDKQNVDVCNFSRRKWFQEHNWATTSDSIALKVHTHTHPHTHTHTHARTHAHTHIHTQTHTHTHIHTHTHTHTHTQTHTHTHTLTHTHTHTTTTTTQNPQSNRFLSFSAEVGHEVERKAGRQQTAKKGRKADGREKEKKREREREREREKEREREREREREKEEEREREREMSDCSDIPISVCNALLDFVQRPVDCVFEMVWGILSRSPHINDTVRVTVDDVMDDGRGVLEEREREREREREKERERR